MLLSYVAAGLGDSLSSEMASSWTKLLDIMVSIVEGEMEGDVDEGLKSSAFTDVDIKAVEKSFELFKATATNKELGIGFFEK